MANLHAFARLYGVVRWFHPSDAAAVIDWDRFAIEGARRVVEAPNVTALRAVLGELIAPIAPTVRLAGAGEVFPDEPALHPADAPILDVVAWEHEGYGDTAFTSAYTSKRRHRDRTVPMKGLPSGALWQAVDATPYRGQRLRLRGKVRTAARGRGQLWVRVERGDAVVANDEMRDRPVISQAWGAAEIIATVDAAATRILFGVQMTGPGTVWFDDLELAAQVGDGTWAPITIADPGFEAADPLSSWKPGLARGSKVTLDGWNVTSDRVDPGSGAASLRLGAATRVLSEELFADAPQPGETVEIDLGSGLRARVPIALYSRAGHTLGDDPAVAARSQQGPPAPGPAGFDVFAGAADVIVVWNVFQHFWPYWDVVSVDWITELDTALRDALDDHTLDDHVATLQRLSAAAPDGHARIGCPGRAPRETLPFDVDVIEGQIVVIATQDPAVQRGDILVSIAGIPAARLLAAEEALASGSPQRRRVVARDRLGTGPVGSRVTLRVRRNGIEQNLTVARRNASTEGASLPAIERLDDGVYYVDLSRASMSTIDDAMERLAAAPGVVFDVRDYPNGNDKVLSHLLTQPDTSKAWLAVPRVIRPDHGPSAISSWDTFGWAIPVLQPHIAGRVAFLTGPGAISYAESVMGFVAHYHLGEIVGSPTAGTNGNVAQIAEPSGCSAWFTGMRVTHSDGSRLHLLGIQPTIPATQTIAGVRAGRDEVLERALRYVRSGS